jgi:bacillolysin
LAYKFDIFAVEPLSHKIYYIDAITGALLDARDLIFDTNTNATGTTLYRGSVPIVTDSCNSVYRLYETRSSNNVVIHSYNAKHYSYVPPTGYSEITNASTTWPQDTAIDAHWGAEKVYDYWLSSPRNRNSLNNAGMAINGYVHFNQGQNADNAFWDGNEMLYGDGYSVFKAAVSLDVVAHETGHGIMQYTANFSSSSGQETQSLNEGFSDIWGAVIENWVSPDPINNWLIGEQIMRNGKQCLRSLRSPKLEGYNTQTQTYPGGYPNTYQKTYWVNVNNCTPTDQNDKCACHTNSTVLSHWFYLLSQGGTGTNDVPSSYSVYGLGLDKAAAIVWQAERVNLVSHPTAQYYDVMTQTIQAATDLSSANSLEVMQVKNSWYAVGIGSQPTQMTIYGPNFFCTSGTFTVNSVPTGCTVLWSASSNITLPSNKSTNPITATVSGNGPGWVLATVSSTTCSVPVKYTVWVGTPVVSVTGPDEGYPNVEYAFQAHTVDPVHTDPFSYTWDMYPYNGYISTSQGGNYAAYGYFTFYDVYSASGYRVMARAENDCGTGAYGETRIWIHDYWKLSPNPASEIATLTKVVSESDNTKVISSYGENITCDIQILNYYGSLQYQATKSGDSFTIPVNNLKDGTYFVKITQGKQTTNLKLVVKH